MSVSILAQPWEAVAAAPAQSALSNLAARGRLLKRKVLAAPAGPWLLSAVAVTCLDVVTCLDFSFWGGAYVFLPFALAKLKLLLNLNSCLFSNLVSWQRSVNRIVGSHPRSVCSNIVVLGMRAARKKY